MTVFRQTVTATLVTQDGYNYALNVLDGTPVLNEGSSPYAYASITIARPAIQVLAALDPTLSPRVNLTITRAPGTSRTFDLLVSARQLETETARVGINLVSDEQFLQDYSLTATTPDVTFWGYQSSVRSIVYNVLNRVLGPSFSIAYGAVDKAIPTFSALKNYITVPSFEVPSGVWIATNAAIARSTAWAQVGTASFQMTPNNMASSESFSALNPGMQPGQTYSMSGYWKGATAQTGTLSTLARRMAVYVQSGTSNLRLLASSTQAPNTTTATRVFGTFTIPEGTTYSEVRIYNGAALGGGVSYWDGLMLTEGTGWETNNITRLAYFDGDTPATSAYSYAWDDAAGLSSSQRTPLVQRDPDFLTWTPGQTAWDFLTAILQTVGLRLFCDEARVWRLVDNDYSVPGLVHVDHGMNLYTHQDLMSRTASERDVPLFADAVVIKYTWRDSRLRDQVAWDRAGATNPQKAYQLERPDTAYPGPGAAAYILTRITARKRQLSVTGANDLSVTPGQEVTVSVPRAPTQTGLVDGVSWDLNSGVMTLQTKGVVNTPANAWINRTTTWAATTGTWAQQ